MTELEICVPASGAWAVTLEEYGTIPRQKKNPSDWIAKHTFVKVPEAFRVDRDFKIRI